MIPSHLFFVGDFGMSYNYLHRYLNDANVWVLLCSLGFVR